MAARSLEIPLTSGSRRKLRQEEAGQSLDFDGATGLTANAASDRGERTFSVYLLEGKKTTRHSVPVLPGAFYQISEFPIPVSPATIYRALAAFERTGSGLRPTRVGRRTFFSGRAILDWLGESVACAICGADEENCPAGTGWDTPEGWCCPSCAAR